MSLDQLVARLEAATGRLEALAGGAPGGSAGGSSEASGEAVSSFDEIVSGPLKALTDASQKIGGEIHEQTEIFRKAFQAQREFIVVVSKSKKPADNVVQDLLKPTSDLISQAQDFREKHRSKKEAFNHLSAISEGIPALGWVMVTPKPAPYVTQMKEAAEFYTNRVLKEGDDNHKAWAKAFPVVLNDLANFVKKYHTTGLVWNPKGAEATAAASSSSSAPAAAAAAPKATPAPAAAAPAAAAPAGGAKPDLFAALNKGGEITSGLKKVDKSQMTHKNPELRATSVVPGSVPPKTEKEVAKDIAADKPAKLALEGQKWAVEYQKNAQSLVIENPEAKHSVYVYKCTASTLVIKGKVNQITLDSCKKTAVVCDNVISGVDVVNCQSCQIQVNGVAPTVSIDKTDGLQIYLSKQGLGTEILSSKSSEMNILIPGAKEDDDMVETPIPEQFKSVYKNGKWHTGIVEHAG